MTSLLFQDSATYPDLTSREATERHGNSLRVQANDQWASLDRPVGSQETASEMHRRLWAVLAVAKTELAEDDQDSFLARRLSELVRRFGADIIAHMPQCLSDPSVAPAVIRETLIRLGSLEDATTLDDRLRLLKAYLKDRSPQMRYAAIRGLAELGDARAATALERALTGEGSVFMQGAITAALREIRPR